MSSSKGTFAIERIRAVMPVLTGYTSFDMPPEAGTVVISDWVTNVDIVFPTMPTPWGRSSAGACWR